MRFRLAALAAAAVAVIFTGGAAWGDPADDNRGLEQACSGPAADNNPHCPRPSGSRSRDNGGGNGGSSGGSVHAPNEATFEEQAASCVGHLAACDFEDRDGDGRPAHFDVCDYGTEDADGDGIPNECDDTDDDVDDDGVADGDDNCPWASNPNQADLDGDGVGDTCDGNLPLDDQDSNDLPDEVDRVVDAVTQDLP